MSDYVLPTEFLVITDPGHGWLVATIDDVNAIGLSIYEFSEYSFVEDGTLYLEEDADATLFVLAYEATTKREPGLRYQEVHHFPRNKAHLPGGMSFEHRTQKCRALGLLIHSAKLAEGEAA